MDLSDVMARVHNSLASELQLRWGGYGTVGYCIDTTALVQQALLGHCDLFPLLPFSKWNKVRRQGLVHREVIAGMNHNGNRGPFSERYRGEVVGRVLDVLRQTEGAG